MNNPFSTVFHEYTTKVDTAELYELAEFLYDMSFDRHPDTTERLRRWATMVELVALDNELITNKGDK